MSEWQPIETAPKDGTAIWAWLFDSGIRAVRWDEGIEDWTEIRRPQEDWSPRWWMPYDALSTPPSAR